MHWLHEAQYSLVLFTLFIQASVGAFWVLLVSDFLKRNAPDQVQDAFTRIGTFILLPLATVGLIASTTHLGRPQYAFRALKNLDTSWMSREIVITGLFFSLIALYTYLWYKRIEDSELRRHVGVITGFVGILAVGAQVMVYMIPGRPQWHHPSTFLLFGASALILGPLAIATIYDFVWGRFIDLKSGEATVRKSHRRLGMTLFAGAIAYAVGLLWRMSHLAGGTAMAAADAKVLGKAGLGAETIQTALALGHQVYQQNGLMLSMQIVLGIGLPALLAVVLWFLHQRKASLKLCNTLIAGSFGLVLLGELAGRALFYLSGRAWF